MSNLQLTSEQLSAVKTSKNPTIVIAGAGTGKTEVIVQRYVFLIKVKRIEPKRILYVSLTNQAVLNFKERIFKQLPWFIENSSLINAYTVHTFAQQIFSKHYPNARPNNKTCAPVTYEECFGHLLSLFPEKIRPFIDTWCLESLAFLFKNYRKLKHQRRPRSELLKLEEDFPLNTCISPLSFKSFEKLYYDFHNLIEKKNLIILDDYVFGANECLSDIKILQKYVNKYDEILCDEFQDLDEIQLEILKKVCTPHRNLFCVGDPDQAIYSFRGSSLTILNKFIEHFASLIKKPNTFKLEKNYRSTPEILRIANDFINQQRTDKDISKKVLFTDKSSGSKPVFYVGNNEEEHHLLIIKQIKELKQQGYLLSSIAILSRNKFTKSETNFLYLLDKYKIPWIDLKNKCLILTFLHLKELKLYLHLLNLSFSKIFSKPDLLKITEYLNIELDITKVKDWKTLIKELSNQETLFYWAFREIQETIEDETTSLIYKAQQIANQDKIFKGFFKKSEGRQALKKILYGLCLDYLSSWDEVMEDVSTCLFETEKINIGTIHQSKGMEFENVFLYKVDKDKFPNKKGILQTQKSKEKQKEFIEEEKKVFYVGVTRAKQNLFLFSSLGKENVSSFIEQIKDHFDWKKIS